MREFAMRYWHGQLRMLVTPAVSYMAFVVFVAIAALTVSVLPFAPTQTAVDLASAVA